MQRLSRLVAATSVAAITCLPVGAALAQSTPSTGPAPTTAAPSTTAADTAPAAEKGKAAPKKKKPARMTRQQEIDRSIDQGTVPARYRSSVPKEYQQYVPFDKR